MGGNCMGKDFKGKKSVDSSNEQSEKVTSFQELTEDIVTDPNLKQRQPTPQPKEMDEIEY